LLIGLDYLTFDGDTCGLAIPDMLEWGVTTIGAKLAEEEKLAEVWWAESAARCGNNPFGC
jgi:hypothetical protein